MHDRLIDAVHMVLNVNQWREQPETIMPYDVLRDPMYKYSKLAVENLFKSSQEICFLFAWFCSQEDFKSYIGQKCVNG